MKCVFFWKLFFFLLGSLKTTDIFIAYVKFLLMYHQQNFIYAFFTNMTVKYLFKLKNNKKHVKNRSNCFLVRINTSYTCDFF